jgi:HlyD family secretion protein
LRVTAEQNQIRDRIEQQRWQFARASVFPELAIQHAAVEQARSQAKLRHDELSALTVHAAMNGVLQSVPVEVGAQVALGTNLARVANVEHLKAQLLIPETLAKDITQGHSVSVDVRNGTVQGSVSRIDPSVQKGTVAVDIALPRPLPNGTRPDLSVDGIIRVDELKNVLYVGRPAFGSEGTIIALFRLTANGEFADRTSVSLGLGSVDSIEVLSGLREGDQVILSDMSQWNDVSRIRLN